MATSDKTILRGPTTAGDSFDVEQFFVSVRFVDGMDPHQYFLWLIPMGGAGGVAWRFDCAEDMRVTAEHIEKALAAKKPIHYDGRTSQLWIYGR